MKSKNGHPTREPLYVIDVRPRPLEPVYPSPWGTSTLLELNHGPDDGIAVTEAGKAYINRREAPPPGFMIFCAVGIARPLYLAAMAGELDTSASVQAAMRASGALDDLCFELQRVFPQRRVEAAQLLVRSAEIFAALGRAARRNPSAPESVELLSGRSSPELLAAHCALEACGRLDNLGLGSGADRAQASVLFSALSDTPVPDFRRASKLVFRLRELPGASHPTDGATHAIRLRV